MPLVCEAFQLKKQKQFGRPSKPTVFGGLYQKNRILKPTKNRRQPAEKRRYQKIHPMTRGPRVIIRRIIFELAFDSK